MKILEIFTSVNFHQIGICFMFFLLIVKTGISLYQYNKEKDNQIKEIQLKYKRIKYELFVDIANFDPGFELFSLLNDETMALLFNVACRGHIERLEFAGIYDKLTFCNFDNHKAFELFYFNWLSIKESFKTDKINSKVFFEMFFKTSKTQ
jgi:hypothetical protein